MICPSCKSNIEDEALKCPVCNVKIGMRCQKCHAYNPLGTVKCINCNQELIKICLQCGAANFSSAEICRKCGNSFLQEPDSVQSQIELPQSDEIVYQNENVSQQKAKEKIVEALLSADKKIIALNGAKGSGKSVVVGFAAQEVKAKNFVWLMGLATPLTQLSPCGLIQDLLLNFFNVPNFAVETLQLKKNAFKFFHSEFPLLTNEEVFSLLNFLYPEKTDFFENILINKTKTIEFLKKIFKTITKSNKTIIFIDNFDYIDGMSYEFLLEFFKDPEAFENIKIILAYNEQKPSFGYFYLPKLKEENYIDISLAPLVNSQMETLIEQLPWATKFLNKNFTEVIFSQAGGNAAYLEQILNLLRDYGKSVKMNIPTTFKSVVAKRLGILKANNPIAYELLLIAAVLGIKFHTTVLEIYFKDKEIDITQVFKTLIELDFIIPMSDISFKFKNSLLWEAVFEAAKEDENFTAMNNKLYFNFTNGIMSSKSLAAIISKNLTQKLSTLENWTDVTRLAAEIGDPNLYVIAQKQSLLLINEMEGGQYSLIKGNIYERLGKLLSHYNPEDAMNYLPEALGNAQERTDILKEIELAGCLAAACMKTSNYYGVLECVDTISQKLSDDYELEVAMIKTRKLDALLKIGNCGEMVNLIDNEIMPYIEKYLDTSHPHKNIPLEMLYETWLKTHLLLANALVFQGDNRAFEVIAQIFEICDKNNVEDKLFLCKTKLTLAFANTIKGDLKASEMILEDVLKYDRMDVMDNECISKWNLINILNNFFKHNFDGMQDELFQVTTFANNVGDLFTKNILKTLLGKLFKEKEQAKHALEIYSDQITFFAKEKSALGALLTWYLIAEAAIIAEGAGKSLEVSRQALDVAQNPKINNYLFMTLLNKIMAEACIIKSDYETAKIHIEKAILIARKFELNYLLTELYVLYGKYLQELAIGKVDDKEQYILGASKMYTKAAALAQTMNNNHLITEIQKARTVLRSFAKLNDVELKF